MVDIVSINIEPLNVHVSKKLNSARDHYLVMEKEGFPGIISLLRFFAESRRYGVIDRISYALNYESVREALTDAFRIVESLRDRAITAKIRVEGGKEYTVSCCGYGEGEGPGINGIFIECQDKSLEGKRGWCVPCPERLPDEEEVKRFLEEVKRDPSIAKDVALLSHTWRTKKEVST